MTIIAREVFRVAPDGWGEISEPGPFAGPWLPLQPVEPGLVVGEIGRYVERIGELLAERAARHVERASESGQSYAWLPKVYSLVEKGEYDHAGDMVFDEIDDLLLAGNFEHCNEALRLVDVKRLDSNLMVAFLSVTLTARDHLPSRKSLVRRVEQRLREIAPDRVEALLRTLR